MNKEIMSIVGFALWYRVPENPNVRPALRFPLLPSFKMHL